MQADTVELRDIMAKERRYVIPTFQRDYEWTREGQWALLFDDLDTLADRLGQARRNADVQGISLAKAQKAVSPHFLGAIVCDQLPSSSKELDVRAVIDGQQRLTTLQLMVRGTLDVLIEQGSERAKTVRRMLQNPDDVVRKPHEKHKLWPRRADRDVWPTAMSDDVPHYQPTDHLYLQARKFFADSVRTAAVAVDGADRTEDLVDALLDFFKLVMIDLEENDDAQIIFEVLNGRQTPLSASDLVKNLLFLRGELSGEAEMDSLYERYWADFDTAWWKENVGSGHAARAHRDVLLSVWLTAASGREANVGHLYGEVRNYLAESERKTEDVLAEIAEYARAYQAIYGKLDPDSSDLATSYYRVVTLLRVQLAVPLLAWLRTLPVARLSLDDHVRAVQAVESWVVRRTFVGANTRGYNAAFMSVLRVGLAAVENPALNVAGAVIGAFQQAPNSLAWPSDAQVSQSFINDQFYDRFTQARLRMLLGAIDTQLRQENPKTEPATFDYSKLQLEHVMPRSWKTHWPLHTGEDQQRFTAELRRNGRVNNVGNLTLVTSTFNQSVSNQAWMVKRTALAAQSALQLNQPFAACAEWDEDAISARAQELAEVACRVWPRTSP